MASIGTIGKYERLDVLGHGTSGVVYLAWDTLLRRNVALKEIRAAGPEMEKVLDEARVLDRLGRHPHIVQVHSVDHVAGAVLIDMELIRGGNLADLLRERGSGTPLPPAEAIRIATAVLDALGFAHERRIIHRDIKPANILIGAGGLVKLTDFGLAEALGSGSVAGGGGTYPYMAPEDFAEDAASDYRSDLWAVGVVLYEMLTGRRPFQVAARTRDPFAWKRAIAGDEPPPPTQIRPDLPPAFDAILRRALAKAKTDRYPSARAFADALAPVAAALPATAPLAAPHHEAEGAAVIGPTAVPPAQPPLPPVDRFVFANGATATDLDGFLALAARHWDEAREALLDGRIEQFLRAVGEVYIADLATELRTRSGDADRRLSEFLHRSQSNPETRDDDHTVPAAAHRPLLRRGVPVGAAPAALPPAALFDERTIAAPRRQMPTPIMPIVGLPAPQPGGESAAALAPADPRVSRWWFWPLYLICFGPLIGATGAVSQSAASSDSAQIHVLLGWGATGFLSAILLLIGQQARVWVVARVLCGITLATGLIATGALVARMLAPQPTPGALMSVSALLMLPIAVLLLVAASAHRLYRVWAWVALLLAFGLTFELARPYLPRMVQFSHRFKGDRF